MPQAVCQQCERRFRLPEGRRASRCPKCGGRVVLTERAPSEDARGEGIPCPSCGVQAWPGDEECHACGHSLVGAKLATGEGSAEAVFGRHQYRQAMRKITYVRVIYVLAILNLALATVGFGVLWGTLGSLVAPFFLLFAVLLGLSVVGFLKVARQPFLWTVFLAVLVTASGALMLLLLGQEVVASRGMVRTAIAIIVVWSAVPVAYKVRHLVAADPDFFVPPKKRKRRARRPVDRGQVTERARARGRVARKQSMRTALLFGAPILLVVIACIYAVTSDRDETGVDPESIEPFEPTVERFVAAWNASDTDAVGALCSKKNSRRIAGWLRRLPARKGWGETLPPIGAASPQEDPRDPTRVTYAFPVPSLGRAELVVRFEWDGERWVLRKISPPD